VLRVPNDEKLDEWQTRLIVPEARELLAEHGVRLELTLYDAEGRSLSSAALGRLLTTIQARLQQAEHTQRLATVGALAAGVSHEARNLLTGILGFTQVLLTKAHDTVAVSDMLRSVESETRRCVEILSNYLKLSRNAGEVAGPLRVAEIVLPVERLVANPLRQRNCTLTLQIDPVLPLVSGRCAELQRVLVNLIFNAADAMRTGGRIHVAARAPRSTDVEISVSDDGPGVPEALRERIFEAFFSTKTANEGTGLGLSLSRSIVEAHGGALVLDQSNVPGARFTVRLPALSRPADE
jgi:two-component system NtrC family sensor kinase